MSKFIEKITNNKILVNLDIWRFNFMIGWGLTHDIRCDLGISLFNVQPEIHYLTIFTIGIWLLRINLCMDLGRSK
jgi:hypothetical protein